MPLIDMKLPKKSKEELKKECLPCDTAENGDRWPYGLQLRFEKDEIDKIPSLATLKVGDTVKIEGMGSVTSVRVSERQNGKKDHSVEIQIEKVGVDQVKKPEKMSMNEFNKWREGGGGK